MCLCGGEGSCRVVRHLQFAASWAGIWMACVATAHRVRGPIISTYARDHGREGGQKHYLGRKCLAVPVLELRSHASSWGGGFRSCRQSALSQLLEAATTRRLQFHSNRRCSNLLVLRRLLLICAGSQSEHSPPFPPQLHFLDVRALLYYLISSLFYV